MTKTKKTAAESFAALSPEARSAGVFFYLRKERALNPEGTFDRGGRFYLSETCPCCSSVREPSRAYPFSHMTHGRSAIHCASLFGADPKDAKNAARFFSAFVDASFVEPPITAGGHALCSAWDEARERALALVLPLMPKAFFAKIDPALLKRALAFVSVFEASEFDACALPAKEKERTRI